MKKITAILIFDFLSVFLFTISFSEPVFAADCSMRTITSVSPQTIRAGDILTITGSGFGTINEYQADGYMNYDKSISFIYFENDRPYERHGGDSFGGYSSSGGSYMGVPFANIINYISWTDSEIKVRIPNNFEQWGGVTNALNTNINKFHLLIYKYSFRQSGVRSDGSSIYTAISENTSEICGNPIDGVNATFYYQPSCSADTWSCGEYQACTSNNQQTRTCTKTFNCPLIDTLSPSTTQSCTYIPPTCTSWTYSDWGYCSAGGNQTRTILSATPQGCTGGTPIITQSCALQKPPKITSVLPGTINSQGTEVEITGENFGNQNSYKGRLYDSENSGLHQILSWADTKIRAIINLRDWNKITNTTFLYIKVKCLDGDENCYSLPDGPYGKDYVSNTFSLAVQPSCTADTWSCGDWNACSSSGIQARNCTKTFDCSTVTTPSPATAQSCTYVPPAPVCTADIWECDSWNTCSPSGIQSRSCRRTFDCSSAQTAAPASDQFCEAPYRPQPTIPNQSEEIVNQSTIIKSTVKLLCPVDEKSASQGSGTVIDSKGTILTNKHVVAGTLGCLVGFINDFDDEPYFGERQIADIVKTSPTQDIAILKIRNPKNKSLPYVDTTRGVSNFSLGTKITTYGYPAKFGTKITYTSGDFSGTDADYLKTTAILEYGNSGGGAYLKNGTFIGVPSAVVKGELNALGYILSINTINAWLGNSSIASIPNNNQFSRVSVLENIDLKKLDTLNLFIPNSDEDGFPDVSKNHQNITAIKFLKERKIVNGYPDGTFKPEGTVNRAELLTILVNAKIGKPDGNQYKNCFPDVKTEWFAPYVCYAKNAGWVKGYPDGKYRPGQTVNKVEALTILLNSQSISTSNSVTSKPFNDVNTTDWFAKYVAKAKALGILEETGNMLSPGEGMKRAGVSEILYRLLTK